MVRVPRRAWARGGRSAAQRLAFSRSPTAEGVQERGGIVAVSKRQHRPGMAVGLEREVGQRAW